MTTWKLLTCGCECLREQDDTLTVVRYCGWHRPEEARPLDDLRAGVLAMRYTLVAGSRVVFVDDVLALIDGDGIKET